MYRAQEIARLFLNILEEAKSFCVAIAIRIKQARDKAPEDIIMCRILVSSKEFDRVDQSIGV